MEEKPKDEARPAIRVKTLRCRRTGQTFDVPQHARCPYCFADDDTIAKSGDYEDFCDFDPEKDPINFGFRHDSTRNENG
jgi:hypothetical protein